MSQIWDLIFYQPIINGLIAFYKLFGNLGVAIIAFTVFVRLILVPLTLPSLRASQKMRELAPALGRLKERHKGDRSKLAQAQMELYRQKGVNPASGCLPQIIQIVILIALFQAFFQTLSGNGLPASRLNNRLYPPLRLEEGEALNTPFLYLDLAKPDLIKISGLPFPLPGFFLLAAAVVQLISSKMMAPAALKEKKEAAKTKGELDDIMTATQQQMLYLFPLMTIVIGLTFPSGVVLYWFVFSLFQTIQQYAISGWGGLTPWVSRLGLLKSSNNEERERES